MRGRRGTGRGLRRGLVTTMVLLAVGAVAAPTAGLAPASAAASSAAPRLTKERLYELARQRPYGTPVALDVPGEAPIPLALTDSGIVLGTTRVDGGWRLFRWRDGRSELQPELADADPQVHDLNDAGQVLLSVDSPVPGEREPLVWEPDGSVTSLADAGPWSQVGGINAHGVVLGLSTSGQPMTWSDGTVTRWDVPGGYRVFIPYGSGINDRGDFVATVVEPTRLRPYVWRDGTPVALPFPAGTGAVVRRITEGGAVLGNVDVADTPAVVLWSSSGRMRYVDRNYRYGLAATDVNEHGVVVGIAESRAQRRGPVRSDSRGVAARLPGLEPGSETGWVSAVHDLDVAVGMVPGPGGGREQPVMWVLTVPVPLGTRLDGVRATGGQATDINASGQVLGLLEFPSDDVWTVRRSLVLWDLVP